MKNQTKNKDNEEVWLTKLEEIPVTNEVSLRRSLLTSDGKGVYFKEACLNELLKRKFSPEDCGLADKCPDNPVCQLGCQYYSWCYKGEKLI